VSHEPICGVDVLPTLCEVAGLEIPQDRTIDGTSFLPALRGKPIERKTPLYWQFNQASTKFKVALRSGDWKIVATLTGPEWKQGGGIELEHERNMKQAELATFELYNLRQDIGETTDLAASEPEKLSELKQQLHKKYHEVRDESPIWPEWEFARYEGMKIREGKAARKEAGWDDY
jgi:arylsulfatase A